MLTVESLRDHCRTKPGSQETFPFDLHTLVFKVAGKTYALCGVGDDPLELSLKCVPDEAQALRNVYPAVSFLYQEPFCNYRTYSDMPE